jgi:hypothetical protein
MSNKTVANTALDPTLPKTEIELKGKKYFLCYDFNAIAVAENLSGINMLTAIDFQKLDAGKLRALLFAALLKLQPELTLEAVGDLMPLPTMFGELATALAACYYGANSVDGIREEAPENPATPESL